MSAKPVTLLVSIVKEVSSQKLCGAYATLIGLRVPTLAEQGFFFVVCYMHSLFKVPLAGSVPCGISGPQRAYSRSRVIYL